MLTNYQNLRNKNGNPNHLDLSKPDDNVLRKTQETTKRELDKAIGKKIKSASVSLHFNSKVLNRNVDKSTGGVNYVRYTPKHEGLTDNPEGHQRLVRISELPKDPMDASTFKHKRIPGMRTDALVPVMHSPPRKLTAQDQKDWKVPPCISNWKNAKGFTIPIHMRISADGRNNRSYEVSDRFSAFTDVLYLAEKQARKEIEERNRVQETIKMVDTLKKEKELKEAARDAKDKKLSMAVSNISSVNTTKTEETEVMLGNKRRMSIDKEIQAEKEERDKWRNMRRKDIQREKRMEFSKKKGGKDEDRDISERIALGQAQPSKKDNMVDSRLYNQTTGLESGYGDEEDYTLYDKPLFTDRSTSQLYKGVKSNSYMDEDSGEQSKNDSKRLMEKIHSNKKNFEGADLSKSYGGKPIEFEKTTEEYGLNNIHSKKK
jgi:SNW domain-containing protein 1